ncbi:MAG: hypothetical protein RJA77_1037 [Pseudomonadota bacterium]
MSIGLQYPLPNPPAAGQTCMVADGVLWARMPMPFSLDHINVYVLRDRDGWWVVDTGLNRETCRRLWHEIWAGLSPAGPLKGVICTHFHDDHTGLAGWFEQEWQAPIYMSVQEYLTLATDRRLSDVIAAPPAHHLRYFQRAGFDYDQTTTLLQSLAGSSHGPMVPSQYRRLKHGDVLTIGECHWQVIVGSGHSPEHVCLYSAQLGLLLSGDQVLPGITSNVCVTPVEPLANPLRDWLESLERLMAVPDDVLVLPSHQLPFKGLHARLQFLYAHHEQALRETRQACEGEGADAVSVMRVLFPRIRSSIDQFLALGEAMAHLNYLLARDDLEALEREAGATRYRTRHRGSSLTHEEWIHE